MNRRELELAQWCADLETYGVAVTGDSTSIPSRGDHPAVLASDRWTAWDPHDRLYLVACLEARRRFGLEAALCAWACASARPPAIWARAWQVSEQGDLVGYFNGFAWDVTSRAACDRSGCEPPNPRHRCGLYGTLSPGTLVSLGPRLVGVPYYPAEDVLGLVRVWGRVIKGPRGCRAEYAAPVVLIGEPYLLERLHPRWREVPTLTVAQALEAMRRGYALEEVI